MEWWKPQVGELESELLLEVMRSNYLNDGEFTRRFENQLAALLNCRYAVAVTSGTTALFLALKALNIGVGDQVLIPNITFIATANAVTLTGASPVLVDIDPHTLTIDPECILRAITPRTKAIIPVHISGRAADMNSIMEIARENDLYVVEDAAEALLSKHEGRCLGTIGHAGAISFSPNKTITTGQGGVVLTDDESLHIRLKELKDQGRAAQGTGGDDEHPVLGFNFKLTNLQAAVGLGQLERLMERVARMRENFEAYLEGLKGIPGIVVPGFKTSSEEIPQWIDVLVDQRDELHDFLEASGMHCRKFWHPLHTQNPYRQPEKNFPVSTRIARKAMWLPSAFQLSSCEIKAVCQRIQEFQNIKIAA